ncbi:hypothetical protein ACFO6R_10635 [Eubacterium multiforme]|uniref:Membrane protein n=1 Tax=Eubacterium multiforme TaxID=83339 RepID=A0ABT9UY21_9FIRM|nr:hypothetical protein [Eubacterium multiforme]MDQ0151217.1 putative membrane protein [Eubacterium multiforme]
MKYFSIVLNIVIVLTLLFLVGKAIYIEHICSKKSEKTTFIIFSGVALINIGLIIIPLTYIKANNINLFSIKYIFILLILILFVFQAIQASRLVLFNHGLLCMGQYIDYKKITKLSIGKKRSSSIILIEVNKDSVTFRMSNKKMELFAKKLRENRVNVKIYE